MSHSNLLAIVGAACRLPGAAGLPEFADMLVAGRSAVREVPPDRWTKARYFHPAPGHAGKTYSFAAGALADIFSFDPAFFGMSAREALSVDPQQRLILELAYEAMEDAGMLPSRLGGSHTGVYIGASSWDFAAVSFADAAGLDAYGMQGAALSSVANRVSYVFGLRGPSLAVDTACSSSLVALHLACEALRREEIGQAFVGGVNLLIAPQSFVGFARASMLSRAGLCHSFDARADGYVRGEGGGVIVIKPLDAALADGDTIRAVVHATGMNSDGRTNGFSMPSQSAQTELVRAVSARAGIGPDDFRYFEAHGTGTPVGDPIEAAAIGQAIGQGRSVPLPIGSVKSNIGHLEPASGMAGLMKLIVCFERNIIPPSLNFVTPNPRIPFAELNLRVVTEARPLAQAGDAAFVGINSFGFGGTNAHAVLAAPPPAPMPAALPPPSPVAEAAAGVAMPLLISARSAGALRALAGAWRDVLRDASPAAIPALLRGAARHRDQHPHRLAVVPLSGASSGASAGTSIEGGLAEDLAGRLDTWLSESRAEGVATGQALAGGVAFVYSGNGSQWAGMALDALAGNPAFAAFLDDVDARLRPALGWSVIDRLTSSDLPASIRYTAVAQPLLFATQVAAVRTLRAAGVRPVAHVGHSAGEVAAAWASGALTIDQACHVIVQRSLLQGATHGAGGMASIALGEAAAEALIARLGLDLSVGAVNAPGAVTVAGAVDAIGRLEAHATDADIHFVRLDLDYAFHSPAMDPIRAPLLAALAGVASVAPASTMISTVTGRPLGGGELTADYWWRNVRQPVRFAEAVSRLIEAGIQTFVEVGPQPVLQYYLREMQRGAGKPVSVVATLSRRAAGGDSLSIAAAECHVAGADLTPAAGFDGPAALRSLPRYPFQRQRYAAGRTAEAIEVVAPADDHPLLGFRDPAVRDAWMSHLSVESAPWLADHVVDGAVVLPAAAMIDMALAAARVRDPDAAGFEITDLEITRPLVLEPGVVTDCRTSVTPDGFLQFSSRPRLSPDAPQPHATCRIMRGLGTRPVLDVIAPGDGAAIDAALVYARARALRLHYGPAFRTVLRVHGRGAGLGAAELGAGDPGRVAAGHLIDPALLDGSLQALLALVADDPRVAALGSVMPWRFGRVRLLRPGAQPRAASLRVRHVGPRSICADIALSAADGETVAELLDCWFVTVPTADRPAPDLAFWTAYVPSARQPAAPLSDPGDRILAAVAGVDDAQEAILLADACASAIAYEALRAVADGGLVPAARADAPLVGTALRWLREDGLAERQADGWRLTDSSDLPDAADIWRSLLFGAGEAAAECVLLAALAGALGNAGPAGLLLSPALREQALFASPTAREAMAALLRGLDAFTATWPAGSCLRVGVVGAAHATLLRQIVRKIDDRGLRLRLLALAVDADTQAGLQAAVAPTPGASAVLWSALADDAWQSCDLVLDLYGLSLPSRERLTPDQLLRLLAPGGTLLCAEPAPNRTAALLFGPGIEPGGAAALRDAPTWCRTLRDAGFAAARGASLAGAMWPATLLVARAPVADAHPGDTDRFREQAGLVVFAAPNDRIAAALAARQRMLHLMPIEALRDVLIAPFAARQQHVLLLASETAEDDDLAEALVELLADIAAAVKGMLPPQAVRLWLVSVGSAADNLVSAALSGLRRVAANELPGLDCRAISLDPGLPDGESAMRVLQELIDPDQEPEVLWGVGGRMVPRLRAGLPAEALETGPRRLEAVRPGLIGSLTWLRDTPAAPGPHDVAIEVHAAALNFRDVMWAQGLLPDEALLAGFSGPSLGLECAGIVTAVGACVSDIRPGDRVAAVAPAAMATHVVTRRNGVMRVPADLPFAAAATLPVAFMTAVYALGELGRLSEHETVLIHGGAGGVGLAAIQYALHKGAVVYATAGSDMRRQMLRMLGVAGVFDSRDTSFVDDILAATGGRGVDVVLNSVSQELMKQSLRLLRPFGRFLEIGKRDLYRDTPIGIRALRHNASYFAIDVDELVAHRPEVGLRVLNEISDLLDSGQLSPLPYRSFGFADAVPAFRLLQGSGHIGKVVLLPEPTRTPTRMPAEPAGLALRQDGVYVVTGGLTGFGLETARWLAGQGAGKLALISRRGGATPGCDQVLRELPDARAFACDVAEPADLRRVLAEVRRTMGPIVGVLHAAMVLDDARLGDLDAARFAAVIRPKLAGAMALDRLTRDDPIVLFVLFSSVTTVIGTPGQASYVAANRALEALAERRVAEGLPGLAVQWGPIGDAGYLVKETRVSEMLAAMLGSSHLRASQALAALPALVASGKPVIGLADVAWGDLRGRLPGLAGPFWSEMPVQARLSADGQTFRERVAEMTPREAVTAIQHVLVEEIARILQQPNETIGVAQPIHDFGVDSLMAVELQTALEGRLGIQIPLTILTGAATLTAIADRLLVAMDKQETARDDDDVVATIMRHESDAVLQPGE